MVTNPSLAWIDTFLELGADEAVALIGRVKGILLAWLLGGLAAAEELRQGRVFTPEEGAADLAERAKEYPDRAAWKAKAEKIRRGILEGAKLSPLPKKCRLNPIRGGLRRCDGYSVENVAIEALPGFLVTGNLYLPDERKDMPIVLCPHGHWQGADLAEHGRFRPDMQKRCGALARMGCAVFAWDAVGFGESGKLGWKHDFHPEVLRLQLWSAVRALDFLWDLPGADRGRVLVTGASGGGTLTMQLAAVDERVTMSVPCAMVSSYFYGGCDCESGMPVHVRPGHVTNPVEIAAVIAPKQLLVISSGGDWTDHVPQADFPHLRRIYGFFGLEDHVENAHFPDGRHDYGPEKRAALYSFVARHWQLDVARADESRVALLPAESLLVFGDGRPLPDGALRANVFPAMARDAEPDLSSGRLAVRVADGAGKTSLRWSIPGEEEPAGDLLFEWLEPGREAPVPRETPAGRFISRWRVGTSTITRTILADPESGAIFVHLLADMPGSLGFKVSLAPDGGGEVAREDRRQLVWRRDGREVRVWVLPFESDVEGADGGIRVRGEGEALVILDAGEGPRGTTFKALAEKFDPGREPADPGKIWRGIAAAAH